MILGIDIDDTLFDTRKFISICWKEYHDKYGITRYTDSIPSTINTGWDDPDITRFWDLYRDKICGIVEAKKDASISLLKLRSNGFGLKIVTARPLYQRYNTLSSLKRNRIIFDDIIMNAKLKGEACKINGVDLLIDDTQLNLDDAESFGVDTLLFKEHDTWNEVYKKILEINKKRRF